MNVSSLVHKQASLNMVNNTVVLPRSEKILESVALVLIVIFSTALNILTCIIIAKNRALRTRPANVFVANLCLSNLILTWFVVPFSLATLLWNQHGVFLGTACTFNGFFSIASCSAIVFTLCCVSIDRYIAVTKPTRYRTVMTPKRAIYMLTFTWFQSFIFASFPVLGWSHYEYHPRTLHCSPSFNSDCSLYIFLSILGFFIPIVIMVITYIKIFHVIRKHSRIVSSLKLNPNSPTNENNVTEEINGTTARRQGSQRSLLVRFQQSKEISENAPPLSPSSIVTLNYGEVTSRSVNVDETKRDCSVENIECARYNRTHELTQDLQERHNDDNKNNFENIQCRRTTAKKRRRKRFAPKEYKIAKTGFLLLILFLLLWLPYFIVNSCFSNIHPSERVFHFSMCLVYMNGIANPIAYAFNNSIVKSKLRNMFGNLIQNKCCHRE